MCVEFCEQDTWWCLLITAAVRWRRWVTSLVGGSRSNSLSSLTRQVWVYLGVELKGVVIGVRASAGSSFWSCCGFALEPVLCCVVEIQGLM